MRKIKILCIILALLGIGLKSYAQPNIDKETIPSDIPSKIRELIKAYTLQTL